MRRQKFFIASRPAAVSAAEAREQFKNLDEAARTINTDRCAMHNTRVEAASAETED